MLVSLTGSGSWKYPSPVGLGIEAKLKDVADFGVHDLGGERQRDSADIDADGLGEARGEQGAEEGKRKHGDVGDSAQ
jgi:hypothetical protein